MSLNTNGWDYGYHINLEKVNSILQSNSTDDKKAIDGIVNSTDLNIESAPSTFEDLNKEILNQLKKDKSSTLAEAV